MESVVFIEKYEKYFLLILILTFLYITNTIPFFTKITYFFIKELSKPKGKVSTNINLQYWIIFVFPEIENENLSKKRKIEI